MFHAHVVFANLKKLVGVRSEILRKVHLTLVRGEKACEQWKRSVTKRTSYD